MTWPLHWYALWIEWWHLEANAWTLVSERQITPPFLADHGREISGHRIGAWYVTVARRLAR